MYSIYKNIAKTIILLVVSVHYLAAQNNFSKIIQLPASSSCTFVATVIDQDTIVCFGTRYGLEEQRLGAVLAKLDTLGNLLMVSTDFDSIEDQSAYMYSQIVRTSDGGYLCMSAQTFGKKTAVYKFSHAGQLLWRHFYREPTMQVAVAVNAIEVSDGYLIVGRVTESLDYNQYCMKLSKDGVMLWFKRDISITGFNDLGMNRVVRHGANFLMGGTRGFTTPNGVWSATARLMEIDTNGNLVSEWTSDLASRENSLGAMVKSDDEHVIFATRQYEYDDSLNAEWGRMLLRKMHLPTKTVVWEKPLTPFELTLDADIHKMLPSLDGKGIDVVGSMQVKDEGYVVSGWAMHLNWEGEIVWQRRDTGFINPTLSHNYNHLFDMGHLSSGSIIGVGNVFTADSLGYYRCWLIKWSPNGCLEPDDCAPVSSHDNPLVQGKSLDWKLFPNPTNSVAWLLLPDNKDYAAITIGLYDTQGKIIRSISDKATAPGNPIKLPLDGLAAGLYFYQVIIDGTAVGSGRLVVEW